MKTKFTGAVKAGKLANGFERGGGSVIHVIDSEPHLGLEALCGARPKIQWCDRELSTVTCPICIRQLKKELIMSNLLNQVDEMVKSGGDQ